MMTTAQRMSAMARLQRNEFPALYLNEEIFIKRTITGTFKRTIKQAKKMRVE